MGVVTASAPQSQTVSDADLLRAFVTSRDDLAFGRIVGRHARAVRRVAYGYTHDSHAAEDVSQAAFLVLAKRPKPALRSARRRGTLLPWLAKVARYASANWYRADRLRQQREREGARRDVAHDPSAGHDLADAVRVALGRLPRRERRIVELRHLSELSWDEVSRQLGTTPDAARKTAARALARLRETLDRRGITVTGTALLAGLRTLAAPSQTSAAVAVSAVTPPQLAQGVLTMLKLQSAAVTTASLLATAGVVTTAMALWEEQDTPSTANAAPAATDAAAPLVVELSDGTQVTLFAVGEPATGWWGASGGQTPTIDGIPLLPEPMTAEIEEPLRPVAVAIAVQRPPGVRNFGDSVRTPTPIGRFVRMSGTSTGFQFTTGVDRGEQTFGFDVVAPVGKATHRAELPLTSLEPRTLELAGQPLTVGPLVQGEAGSATFTVAMEEGVPGFQLCVGIETAKQDPPTTWQNMLTSDPVRREIKVAERHLGAESTLILTLVPLEVVHFENLAARPSADSEPVATTRPVIEELGQRRLPD